MATIGTPANHKITSRIAVSFFITSPVQSAAVSLTD
jgi:hypothetical protein